MGMQVAMNGQCQCSFGAAPMPLKVLPDKMVQAQNMPAANIMDNKPMVNVGPFGNCMSPSNPANIKGPVVVPGSAPCVPVIPAPWAPGSPTVLIKNMPALNNSSKLMCTWAGVISIINPGTTTVQIP